MILKDYLDYKDFQKLLACSALKSGKHVRGCQNSQSVLRKIHTRFSQPLPPQKWLEVITINRSLVKTKERKQNGKVWPQYFYKSDQRKIHTRPSQSLPKILADVITIQRQGYEEVRKSLGRTTLGLKYSKFPFCWAKNSCPNTEHTF